MTEEETIITAIILSVLFTLMVLSYYIAGIAILKKTGLRKAFREKCLFAVTISFIIAVLAVVTCLISFSVKK